ncbi:MAG TPA: CARDB domain-containing protein, partial [Verrucomicrobiae bacterium]
ITTDTWYYVWSAGGSTNSGVHGAVNSTNQAGDNGGVYYANYGALAADITNTWTLMTVAPAATNFYHFTFSVLASNDFPRVKVLSPLDGAVDQPLSPAYTWTLGPTNYNQLYVQVNSPDYSQYYGTDLPIDSTTWQTPANLIYNSNYFFGINYNLFTNGVATTPLDTNGVSASGWTSSAAYTVYDSSGFYTTNPTATYGHQLVAQYTFNDTNDVGHDSSPAQNDIYCGSGWGTNGHVSVNTAVAGGEALAFFGESSLTPCDQTFTNLENTLLDSFSVSLWLNTTNRLGSDEDDLYYWSGQVIFEMDQATTIPIGITGNKLAFATSDGTGGLQTLHSVADVNTGNYVHVVVTRDAATGVKKIYINGVLDSSGTGQAGPFNGTNVSWIAIGSDISGPYKGLLDEMQIYQGVLSAGDVAALYAHPAETVPDVTGANDFNIALNTGSLGYTNYGDSLWFIQGSTSLDGLAVQSGSVSGTQTSTLQTTITGPCAVYFQWMTTNTASDGFDLEFDVDGNYQADLAGDQNWQRSGPYYFDGNPHTLTWTAYANGSQLTNAAGYLDQLTVQPLTNDFNLALNTSGLTYSPGGDAPWTVSTEASRDGLAARSGGITNGQTSVLSTTLNGPGAVYFQWMTTNTAYQGFDLQFEVDGNYGADLYGDHPWNQSGPYFLSPYSHTLTWTAYAGYGPASDAAGYVDQVVISNIYPAYITDFRLNGNSIGLGYPSANALYGTNLVLQAGVTGSPLPAYSWFKDSVLLPGQTNATLVISNAQIDQSGFYTFHAQNIYGSAETHLNLKIYQPTDLQPLSLSLPANITSGTLVPIAWSVTNTGPGAVSNVQDQLLFVPPAGAPYFLQSVAVYNFTRTNTLGGSVYTVSNLFRFPNVPAGTYNLVLQVNADGQVIETVTNNNTLAAAPVTVNNPDLQAANLQLSGYTNQGGTLLTVAYDTTNNGPGIIDYNLGPPFGNTWYDLVLLSTNPFVDDSAHFLSQINQRTNLAAGQSFHTVRTVTIPVLPSGDYYLLVHVDSYGFADVGGLFESNETNNTLVARIHIKEADLVPVALNTATNVSALQTVSVQWAVANQGDTAAVNYNPGYNNLQWYDAVYLSSTDTVDGGSILLGSNYYYSFNGYQYYAGNPFAWTNVLAPGATYTNTQHILIPNVPAGQYYLVLAADYQNQAVESSEANNQLARPVTVLPQDLAVAGVNLPAIANARSSITASWTVTNLAAGVVSPQWVDRIYISSLSNLDNTAVLLGEYVASNAVPRFGSYTTTNVINLNSYGAGNYYLFLVVDAAHNFLDVNRTNNLAVIPLTINSPDLAAYALNLATNFSSQQPFAAVYTVTNLSNISANPGWSDRFYLSPDGSPASSNQVLGVNGAGPDVVQTGTLAGNASYSELVNLTVPPVKGGDYFLLLQANANTFFTEGNTANNYLAHPLHISNPDLAISNFVAPTSLVLTQYNQRMEADWTVLNQGAGSVYLNWYDQVYLSRTNVLDSSAQAIGAFSLNPVLGSGQSYLGYATLSIPDGISGNYYLLLNVNDSRQVYEANYTNNLYVQPLNLVVPPVPVLSIVTVDSPVSAWSGQYINVTWTLTNAGPAQVSGTFNDVISLCTTANGGNPQTYGSFQFTGQILPGQAVVRTQKIYLPINLQGTFWVSAQTDYNHSIYEFNYRTNDFAVASHPLVVNLTPTPNLVVSNLVAPTNLFGGGNAVVAWNVTNIGAGATSAPFWDDTVYLCDNPNYYAASYRYYLGAADNVAYLNAGESYASSLPVNLPRGLSGTFYFVVIADAFNFVYEGTNKNDNITASAPVFLQPAPTPDLQVTLVQPPISGFSGQTVSLRYAVTNLGLGQTAPAETGWRDRIYLSTNIMLDSSATYLADLPHNGGLIAGQGYQVTNNAIQLPVGISGDWYFIVSADIANEVYEAAFEDNNARTAAFPTHIALTPPPDLVAGILQAPTNVWSGHYLNLTYTVANLGTTITPNAGWNDNFYLSPTPVFNPNTSRYLGTVTHSGALPAGAAYTNGFSVQLPTDFTGTNYVCLLSDPENYVFELDKTNNLAVVTNALVVTLVPADLQPVQLSAPAAGNAGSGFYFSYTVTNRGVGDSVATSWNDWLVLSQNILPGAPSDILLTQIPHNGLLSGGGTYAVTNYYAAIPAGVATGTYQLFLLADPNHTVAVDTNQNNNYLGPVPINVTVHGPDLQVFTASAPTNGVAGAPVTVNFTVKNAGGLPANFSSWNDNVYLTPNGLLGLDTVYLGSTYRNQPLAAGASYTNTLTVTLPANVQSNYFLVVIADAYRSIPEPSGHNDN